MFLFSFSNPVWGCY